MIKNKLAKCFIPLYYTLIYTNEPHLFYYVVDALIKKNLIEKDSANIIIAGLGCHLYQFHTFLIKTAKMVILNGIALKFDMSGSQCYLQCNRAFYFLKYSLCWTFLLQHVEFF